MEDMMILSRKCERNTLGFKRGIHINLIGAITLQKFLEEDSHPWTWT
jgi:hypothetical protein